MIALSLSPEKNGSHVTGKSIYTWAPSLNQAGESIEVYWLYWLYIFTAYGRLQLCSVHTVLTTYIVYSVCTHCTHYCTIVVGRLIQPVCRGGLIEFFIHSRQT